MAVAAERYDIVTAEEFEEYMIREQTLYTTDGNTATRRGYTIYCNDEGRFKIQHNGAEMKEVHSFSSDYNQACKSQDGFLTAVEPEVNPQPSTFFPYHRLAHALFLVDQQCRHDMETKGDPDDLEPLHYHLMCNLDKEIYHQISPDFKSLSIDEFKDKYGGFRDHISGHLHNNYQIWHQLFYHTLYSKPLNLPKFIAICKQIGNSREGGCRDQLDFEFVYMAQREAVKHGNWPLHQFLVEFYQEGWNLFTGHYLLCRAVKYNQKEFFDRYMKQCIVISDWAHDDGPKISFSNRNGSDYSRDRQENKFRADFKHHYEQGEIEMPDSTCYQ